MKKIVLSAVLISTFAFSYEGCGVTKNEALNSLSQSIYVSVKNNLNKKESYSKSIFSTFFSKKIDSSSSQSSSVIIKNAKFYNKNGEVCASVSEKNVKDSAKQILKEIKTFKIDSLPTVFEEKEKKINSMLGKIAFVKAVLKLSSEDLKILNKKEAILIEKSSKGAVVFNTSDVNAKIIISNYNKPILPSQEVELKEGKYSYKILANNKCPVEGELEVKKGKLISINKTLGDYPQITFKSNIPQNKISINLDGIDVQLNKTKILKQCSGNIVWSARYRNQKKDGTIELEPNLKKIIEVDFMSPEELKKLKEKTDFFTNSSEIDINYGFDINSNDSQNNDTLKRIEVDFLKNKGIYKFGGGLAVATPDKLIAKDINAIELLLNFRVQLPEIGDTQLRIGTLPFIPYFGVSSGVDVYHIVDSWDFSDTPAVVRGVAGFNILLHKQFGLNFNYQRDFMDKKDNVFEAGIVLSF